MVTNPDNNISASDTGSRKSLTDEQEVDSAQDALHSTKELHLDLVGSSCDGIARRFVQVLKYPTCGVSNEGLVKLDSGVAAASELAADPSSAANDEMDVEMPEPALSESPPTHLDDKSGPDGDVEEECPSDVESEKFNDSDEEDDEGEKNLEDSVAGLEETDEGLIESGAPIRDRPCRHLSETGLPTGWEVPDIVSSGYSAPDDGLGDEGEAAQNRLHPRGPHPARPRVIHCRLHYQTTPRRPPTIIPPLFVDNLAREFRLGEADLMKLRGLVQLVAVTGGGLSQSDPTARLYASAICLSEAAERRRKEQENNFDGNLRSNRGRRPRGREALCNREREVQVLEDRYKNHLCLHKREDVRDLAKQDRGARHGPSGHEPCLPIRAHDQQKRSLIVCQLATHGYKVSGFVHRYTNFIGRICCFINSLWVKQII
ncbi:hypothetical protein B0H13DRAFT_1851450 [Mycena leptocephala]|nr:hypothetical protein B0H13DRAFT_1851450 [Mycena leptocephala]